MSDRTSGLQEAPSGTPSPGGWRGVDFGTQNGIPQPSAPWGSTPPSSPRNLLPRIHNPSPMRPSLVLVLAAVLGAGACTPRTDAPDPVSDPVVFERLLNLPSNVLGVLRVWFELEGEAADRAAFLQRRYSLTLQLYQMEAARDGLAPLAARLEALLPEEERPHFRSVVHLATEQESARANVRRRLLADPSNALPEPEALQNLLREEDRRIQADFGRRLVEAIGKDRADEAARRRRALVWWDQPLPPDAEGRPVDPWEYDWLLGRLMLAYPHHFLRIGPEQTQKAVEVVWAMEDDRTRQHVEVRKRADDAFVSQARGLLEASDVPVYDAMLAASRAWSRARAEAAEAYRNQARAMGIRSMWCPPPALAWWGIPLHLPDKTPEQVRRLNDLIAWFNEEMGVHDAPGQGDPEALTEPIARARGRLQLREALVPRFREELEEGLTPEQVEMHRSLLRLYERIYLAPLRLAAREFLAEIEGRVDVVARLSL